MQEVQYSKLRQAVLNARRRVGRNRCAGVATDLKVLQLIKTYPGTAGLILARIRIIDVVMAGGEPVDTLVRRTVDVPLQWWESEMASVAEGDILVVSL